MADPTSAPDPRPAGGASLTLAALTEHWWVPLVTGLLNLAAGLVVLIAPHTSLLAVALIIGIYLVIAGVVLIMAGFGAPRDRWLIVALGVLGVLAGIFVILRPDSAVHGVRIVLGIYLVLAGILYLGVGALVPEDRLFTITRGLLELAAGLVFLFAPKIGLAALALIVGIYLLMRAALEIALAMALRQARGQL